MIYSRPGCRLCEEAKASIETSGLEHLFTLEEINIDDHPDLQERYGYDIPVVLINRTKVFKHKVEVSEFRRKLLRLSRHT
ncbi:MAG: hypothetical protein DMF61_02310 [Blastocatellia bacterium AA13]|nr:MAG: hypothetical protein DMF61_02310 [Blastocatellia bacterium AA13]